jgi:hypothetical protein
VLPPGVASGQAHGHCSSVSGIGSGGILIFLWINSLKMWIKRMASDVNVRTLVEVRKCGWIWCAASECINTYCKLFGLSFFRFPKDEARWLPDLRVILIDVRQVSLSLKNLYKTMGFWGCCRLVRIATGTRNILHRSYRHRTPSHSWPHFRFLSATPSTYDVIKHTATKSHSSRESDIWG